MRYFIEIAYHGKNYHGWQNQPDAITVQEVLEKTLSTLLRKEIQVVGAGRTDAGVHAKQLFAHFDFDRIENLSEVIFRLNSFLPKDISVKNIIRVKEDAHARFDATAREYEYLITTAKNPFFEELAYHVYQKPDIQKMNEAAALLLDYNDFQCFSRSNTDVKTYYCKLEKADWVEDKNSLIFTIKADRFLRNMVRAIVGTLLEVGYGKLFLEGVHAIIESKDRSNAGASAPAHGLYLTKVEYPSAIFVKD
ncbi:tRNA pseudouridine(38-40) synthase TruA [Jejudonia soesokkakensis]|uniref:tRNA pseudouridine synthase A n=1 Tax=Jejudonia soesokkakensis TaxID=1323432 RepID=A0ABW2N095_9FLAO